MIITYRVETATTGGMHEVIAITRLPSGDGGITATIGDAELAFVRSAVRGQLDLLGHEFGPAVTLVDVTVTGEEPKILSCRTADG